MSSSLGETDAVLILVATLGMLAVLVAFLLVMLERLRRRRVLEKGLIHLVFLPNGVAASSASSRSSRSSLF